MVLGFVDLKILDIPGTPYGSKPISSIACYLLPALAPVNLVSDDLSLQYTSTDWDLDLLKRLPRLNITRVLRHVLLPNTGSFPSCRRIDMDRQLERPKKHLPTTPLRLVIYVVSNGQPSPPSSIASFFFSSGSDSSSTGSPHSSQGSSTATSPPISHYIQRQPRIQHPQKTAEFGHNNLSRLPLTPPIIARLTVRDSSGNSVVPDDSEAELPFLVAHLSLFSADGITALDMGSSIGSNPPLLYGNLVSSIDQLEDLQDVSIRWRGRFQLGISVMKICRVDRFGGMEVTDRGVVLAETRTRPFDVLPYSQYTAIR
ncbi:hypothetical protein H0H92_006775 [Tricholoma furcatifolium]|nr:hypothetical protein H0H92_006775 [Tricholoma furcatifolium]